MNGVQASLAELRSICNGFTAVSRRRPMPFCACRPRWCIGRGDLARHPDPHRGSGLPHESCGSPYGRCVGRDAEDAGATTVIVGHSERRADLARATPSCAPKAEAAWRAGLVAIICIGETQTSETTGRPSTCCRGRSRVPFSRSTAITWCWPTSRLGDRDRTDADSPGRGEGAPPYPE